MQGLSKAGTKAGTVVGTIERALEDIRSSFAALQTTATGRVEALAQATVELRLAEERVTALTQQLSELEKAQPPLNNGETALASQMEALLSQEAELMFMRDMILHDVMTDGDVFCLAGADPDIDCTEGRLLNMSKRLATDRKVSLSLTVAVHPEAVNQVFVNRQGDVVGFVIGASAYKVPRAERVPLPEKLRGVAFAVATQAQASVQPPLAPPASESPPSSPATLASPSPSIYPASASPLPASASNLPPLPVEGSPRPSSAQSLPPPASRRYG